MPLERFIPKSPDPFIRNSQDFEVAKFGHLNTIIEYVNTYVVTDSLQLAGIGPLTSTARYITDSLGNASSLAISTTRVGIGTNTPVNLLSVDTTNSTLPTEHSAAAATIKSSVQSPLRVLRTGSQPNIWIGTSSTNPNVSSFLFGIRTGAYYNTATPTYSGDYAPWIVSRGNDWGTATSASDLRMSQIFTVDGNTGRAALAIYPSLVETATNTDIVNMNNLLIATRNSFSTLPLARLQIIGDGQTSGTTSLLVQNSLGSESLRITDDKVVKITSSAGATALNVEFGNINSNVKILSHGSSDFSQIQIGTNFSLERNGGGDPTITTTFGLGVICNSLSLQTSTNAPCKLWIRGNYGLGSAYFGANNSNGTTASTLYFQNSETPTAAQNVIATFNLWSISDSATAPTITSSSMFSLESTTRGFLPPRMTTAQRTAIVSPAAGLIVYDTTTNKSYTYDGTAWQAHY